MNLPSTRTLIIAGSVALIVLAWLFWWRSDERAIRRELRNLAADATAPATEGFGTLSWAARLGTYFTDDAVIDIGSGTTSPIVGRPSVVGIAARLQPRFANATVSIDDFSIQKRERGTADVRLTATFTPASQGPRDEPIDAREFAVEMKKDGGRWRMSRVTAVDVLR